jgi:integrase|tara:strand:- start:100 stop:1461 length:1362 start_codon:yes stop_codon:yes gene_type:complete
MQAYKILRTDGIYPFHVVDQDGLPHLELTLYACIAPKYHSSRTARAYVKEVVAFASWTASHPVVIRQNWQLLGAPEQVRALLAFFFTSEMKCVVALGKDRLGFETRRIEPTWETGRRLERLLAALRSFYGALRLCGRYHYDNPMDADGARQRIEKERRRLVTAHIQTHGRGPMPPESGVDLVREVRFSAAYFRLRGDKWLPEVLDDPSLMNAVVTAGDQWGWSMREMGLVRVLFDTGCRLHEACHLTMADWFHSRFMKELVSINKGSHGRRTKRLFITDRTVKVLQRYVDEQRVLFDPYQRNLAAFAKLPTELLRDIPLFLTKRGTPLDPDHFRRDYWAPALSSSGLQLRCHQVRHWFVTMALNDVHKRSRSEEELQNSRGAIRELMAWKTDMLPTYDQAIRRHNLPELAHHIHVRMEQEHSAALARKKKQSATKGTALKTASQQMLEEMLGP